MFCYVLLCFAWCRSSSPLVEVPPFSLSNALSTGPWTAHAPLSRGVPWNCWTSERGHMERGGGNPGVAMFHRKIAEFWGKPIPTDSRSRLKEGECLSKDLRKEMDGHQKRWDGMPQTSNNLFRFVSRPCQEVNEIYEMYVLFYIKI